MKQGKQGKIIVLVSLVVLLFFGACSAEELTDFSGKLEGLALIRLGDEGKKAVDEAVVLVNGFVDSYESCIVWTSTEHDAEKNSNQKNGGISISISILDDKTITGSSVLISLVRGLTAELKKAMATKENDKALQEALSKPYSGQRAEMPTYLSLGEAEAKLPANTLTQVLNFLGKIYIQNQEVTANDIKALVFPFPAQTYDISLLEIVAGNILSNHPDFIVRLNSIVSRFFVLPGSTVSTGRSDEQTWKQQTVGDKIKIYLITDALLNLFEILETYSGYLEQLENPPEDSAKYEQLTYDWVLLNCYQEIMNIVSDFQCFGYVGLEDWNVDAFDVIEVFK